jgi:hypothetical protein
MTSAPADAAPSSRETEHCPCAQNPSDRTHDGFFFRSSPGFALFAASVSDTGSLPRRSRSEGLGLSSALSIGGTPAPGLVVGGTLWTVNLFPRFVEDGVVITPDDDSVKLTVLRIGPYFDWYPNPKGGFHTSISPTWMFQIERDRKGQPVQPSAMGPSLTFHTGYEWFLSSEFSLGGLAGLSFGQLSRQVHGRSEVMPFLMPEIALAVTYH